MTSRGDLITAAIKMAIENGMVDKTGRPLVQWVAISALGPAGVALTEGERQGAG